MESDTSSNLENLKLSNKEDHDIITLRLLDLTDVDEFMEWFGDDNVSKFCSWDTFKSKEDAISYVVDVAIPHPWFKAICLNGKPIGTISVSPFHGTNKCRGELGYVIASKYWGKGIATKAVKMAVSAIFVDWPHLERLEAVVDVDNPGSQRVLEKVGFKKEVINKLPKEKGRKIHGPAIGIMRSA
ncbi:hypothetical protein H5410_048280 [Solanum commersonii]|uniref:N-acetyltransferase domain-containing protein n=1 Tax=Solanum commersonii TaxID=4109 RepID=A0A9J5XL83_SOLCO|nr:hypothetical protein H5410_048280 [Solanum commersonii]